MSHANDLTMLAQEREAKQVAISVLRAEITEIDARIAHLLTVGRRGGLTARERQVLDLLMQGLQDKEIAARLVISPRTVKFHVSAILVKRQAADRKELLARMSRWNQEER